MQTIEAIYENGVLRPIQPLDLEDGENVTLTLQKRNKDIEDALSILELAQETDLPADFATNVDYYLYGLPKQSETSDSENE